MLASSLPFGDGVLTKGALCFPCAGDKLVDTHSTEWVATLSCVRIRKEFKAEGIEQSLNIGELYYIVTTHTHTHHIGHSRLFCIFLRVSLTWFALTRWTEFIAAILNRWLAGAACACVYLSSWCQKLFPPIAKVKVKGQRSKVTTALCDQTHNIILECLVRVGYNWMFAAIPR